MTEKILPDGSRVITHEEFTAQFIEPLIEMVKHVAAGGEIPKEVLATTPNMKRILAYMQSIARG